MAKAYNHSLSTLIPINNTINISNYHPSNSDFDMWTNYVQFVYIYYNEMLELLLLFVLKSLDDHVDESSPVVEWLPLFEEGLADHKVWELLPCWFDNMFDTWII